MLDAASPVPADHPLMKAWESYKLTNEYTNSKGWALQIAPMVQAAAPDAEHQRRFEIMPFEQRERHVEGSLWVAFMAGFEAASRSPLDILAANKEWTEEEIKAFQDKWDEIMKKDRSKIKITPD
jgi:hypothetical protein